MNSLIFGKFDTYVYLLYHQTVMNSPQKTKSSDIPGLLMLTGIVLSYIIHLSFLYVKEKIFGDCKKTRV